MRVTERSFDRGVSIALLVLAVAYLLRMVSYPSNAGRVPAVVAAVMIAALVVQLALSFRRGPEPRPDEGEAAPPDTAASPQARESTGPAAGAGQPLEENSYATLIALRSERRRRFLAISGFTVAFYLGVLAVGFVVTSALLLVAIFLYSRERLVTALLAGAVGAAVAYGFIVLLLELPALEGYVFD